MQVLGVIKRFVHHGDAMLEFSPTEGVVGVDEDFDDSLERLEAAAKAAAAAGQNGDVGAQVGVDALDIVRIFLSRTLRTWPPGKTTSR